MRRARCPFCGLAKHGTNAGVLRCALGAYLDAIENGIPVEAAWPFTCERITYADDVRRHIKPEFVT